MDLGRRIAEARHARGLSLRALAARAGLAPSTVKRIEDGTRDATVDVAERLLAALGLALAVRPAGPEVPSLEELAARLAGPAAASLAGVREQVLALEPPARRAWIATPFDPAGLPAERRATLAALVESIANATPGALRPPWIRSPPSPPRNVANPGPNPPNPRRNRNVSG